MSALLSLAVLSRGAWVQCAFFLALLLGLGLPLGA